MSSPPSLMPRLRTGSTRMQRLDRVGWRAGTCFKSFGLRIGIRANEATVLDRLAPHLPPGWQPRRSPLVDALFSLWLAPAGERRARNRVFVGRRRRVCTSDSAEALAVLESEIRQTIAASAPHWTFVHAGVVGWKGRALVVPGRSRSGKSTLVGELVRAGAEYLSDEFAVLDGRGRVHPFAKPLTLRGASGCDRHARSVEVSELGGTAAAEPLPIGLIALTGYRPGARWQPTRLSAGRAVLELLAHTVPARLRPEESLAALERAAREATVLKGERGEASELARGLLAAVSEGGPGRARKPAGRRMTP
jgi:hypothetical protein